VAHGRLHVSRAKNGVDSVHPIGGVELRALRRLQREQGHGRYVFLSERGAPMGPPGFRRMVVRLGEAAKIPFPVHPHIAAPTYAYIGITLPSRFPPGLCRPTFCLLRRLPTKYGGTLRAVGDASRSPPARSAPRSGLCRMANRNARLAYGRRVTVALIG